MDVLMAQFVGTAAFGPGCVKTRKIRQNDLANCWCLIKAATTGRVEIFLDVSWNNHFEMLRLKATIAVQMTRILKP